MLGSSLTDDNLGDDTGVDGWIIDQGGPCRFGSQPIPTLNEWGMIGLSLLLASISYFMLRRRESDFV